MNQCYRPDLIIWLRIQKVHKPRNQISTNRNIPAAYFIIEVIVDHFTDILLFPVTNFPNTSNSTQSSEEEFMRTSTVVYTKLLAFIAICWNEGHNPTFFVYHLQIYDHFYNIIAIEKPNISAIVKLRTVCV